MSAKMPRLVPALAGLAAIAVSGCANDDPLYRPGTWHPTGVNERNLQVMVANPYDLEAGVGAPTERGNSASRAVTRLLTDRRRPLLNATLSRIGPGAATVEESPLGTGQGGGGNAGR